MGWLSFLFAYVLGGITFLPLVVGIVFVHAYFIFPYREDGNSDLDLAVGDLIQSGDDLDALKAAKQEAKTKATPSHHEPDVAAGYFAVCREYTPMGINAKPIERSTPVGSATVATPSPSVYQTMYRSIFDRKTGPGPLDNNGGASQRPRRAGNVFYVVLRHGHLMLFDDDEQLEVRHVVSLAHHDISIYSGEKVIPEGELYIKRNAICLSRRTDGLEVGPDSQISKPFYLFSENCSAKEDFYFALLRNQEQSYSVNKNSPSPIQFDVRNIISLVQKLHSSEEHMQTRWLNAMIGRVFLGVHKTKDMENLIREKLTKKISRVKRPAFLSNIEIRGIDTGESAPYITNPRLKDLTVEGECGMEADMRYTGNFRLEVAATARIDLGARFKVREVNLVLAVVIRKLEGHMLFKIKPPPSNRLWFSFQQAPKMEMTIEPIVSSRQITYTVILRQIESRIKEVIAETLVLPFWDDMPFFNTEHKKWRGGVFHDDTVQPSVDLETVLAQEGDLEDIDRLEDSSGIESELPAIEKSHSMPVLEKKPSVGLFGRRMSTKSKTDATTSPSASTTSIDIKHDKPDLKSDANNEAATSRSVPSASFVQAPAPVVKTDATNADIFKPSSTPPNESAAATAMATLSAKTQSLPHVQLQAPSPFKPYVTSRSSHSSSSSHEATDTEKDADITPQARRNTASSAGSHDDGGVKSPSLSTRSSIKSQTGSIARGLFGRRDISTPPTPGSLVGSDAQRRTALTAVSNVAASAKQWGLSALQRHASKALHDGQLVAGESTLDLNQPMGRGRPLPPPGTPLPMPDKSTPIPVPKRKPLAPPPSPPQHNEQAPERRRPIPPPQLRSEPAESAPERRYPLPPPSLPMRRQIHSEQLGDEDNMLIVAAPADSEPTTPLSRSPGYMGSFVEDAEELSKDSVVTAGTVDSDKHLTEDDHGNESTTPAGPTAQDDDDYSAWMDNSDEPDVDDAADPVKG
ncbi:testis-expressed sequence 2 protein [Podospora aff. communis PSN243]|uniref:Testis-expressed sequence 2 protein n=1 Tax=Podospora aff. communis PSN243 TaxID=3040156 RepID=A0AAV9GWW6_9PEZI|nr:testis-expressed sequence 2 protein [Podospora aff. communis PSN243]